MEKKVCVCVCVCVLYRAGSTPEKERNLVEKTSTINRVSRRTRNILNRENLSLEREHPSITNDRRKKRTLQYHMCVCTLKVTHRKYFFFFFIENYVEEDDDVFSFTKKTSGYIANH